MKEYDFVIADECHNAFSSTRIFLQDRKHSLLKLTATLHKKENLEDVCYYYSYYKANVREYLQDYRIKVV